MYRDPHKYDSIINLPYNKSKNHKWMSNAQRAGQFAPFAALNGHAETLDETARRVDDKLILDEDQKSIINMKLQHLFKMDHPYVEIVYFKKDERKQGGAYIRLFGNLNAYIENKNLILIDNIQVNIDDLYSINHSMFDNLELE